jgi:Spy/CpxP family protein refolding chaperone
MQYKEKLLELIFSTEKGALAAWIRAQPILERIDISRELKEVLPQVMTARGKGEEAAAYCEQLVKAANKLEESYLDAQLSSLEAELAEARLAECGEKLDKQMRELREYMRECLEAGGPNTAGMIETIAGIIASEKENNCYIAEEWLWFAAYE